MRMADLAKMRDILQIRLQNTIRALYSRRPFLHSIHEPQLLRKRWLATAIDSLSSVDSAAGGACRSPGRPLAVLARSHQSRDPLKDLQALVGKLRPKPHSSGPVHRTFSARWKPPNRSLQRPAELLQVSLEMSRRGPTETRLAEQACLWLGPRPMLPKCGAQQD